MKHTSTLFAILFGLTLVGLVLVMFVGLRYSYSLLPTGDPPHTAAPHCAVPSCWG
jgi:hypothetical protein